MSEERLTLLQRAADLTSAMLQMAEAGQWAELATYQQERSTLLERAFPLAPEQQTENTRTLISSMIEQNQQLEQRCRDARQVLQTELHGLNKNRQAVEAYQAR